MPFYKIIITLKSDQPGGRKSIAVVREFEETDLDRVWHMIHIKSEGKWGRLLSSFDCVRISKRSPDYMKFLKAKQQNKFEHYDDILSPVYFQSEKKQSPETKPESVNGKYRNKRT